MNGGGSGPSIVKGKPEESLLIKVFKYEGALRMPPGGKLPDETIARFEEWIRMGAPDPRETVPQEPPKAWGDMASRRRYWSYQPVHDFTPPAVSDSEWPRDDLDRFILATLQRNGLVPSPDAKPNVLLRRLYFDFTGLPPSPAALAASALPFRNDCCSPARPSRCGIVIRMR